MSDASYDRMREAIRHLIKPPAERLADARKLVGPVVGDAPAWLDDRVMNRCRDRGYLTVREVASQEEIEPGQNIASCGDGRYYVTEVTDAGRAFAARD